MPNRSLDLGAFLAELRLWADAGGLPVRTISYGAGPDQVADLRLPLEGEPPFPVAVVIHGGFWRAQFSRGGTAAVAVALAQQGWASWNVEFRRIGSGGGVPQTLDDVAAAVAALADVDEVDAQQAVAVGHSAGGHLALWLAATGSVRAVVSLAGVADLVRSARDRLGGGAASELLGAMPDDAPDRYALADPAQRLPSGVPQLLVHGTADDRVPIDYSRTYAERARAAGDRCELLELGGVGHFELIDPRTEAWAQVAAALAGLR